MKRFTLSRLIRERRALRFASRFYPLEFTARMRLAKAEKAITRAFETVGKIYETTPTQTNLALHGA